MSDGWMSGDAPEICDECGFDARAWRVADAATLLRALGEWWRLATDGIGPDVLNRRPTEGVWSPLEYGVHSALITAVVRAGLEAIIATDGVELPSVGDGSDAIEAIPPVLDRDAVVADLEREGAALARLVKDAPAAAWAHRGRLDGQRVLAEAGLLHAAHDASHHMMDIGRGLVALGAALVGPDARVHQVNASGGGVPKHPVGRGDIGFGGLAGDRQADRKHHGRPFQALCLWSTEVIDALVAAGHPIAAGRVGENVTVAGVDWAALRPGTRLRLGSAVAEISYPATPCAKQTQWFADGDFRRIDHDRNPQWTRWYAWVREPGAVEAGDAVVVSPA